MVARVPLSDSTVTRQTDEKINSSGRCAVHRAESCLPLCKPMDCSPPGSAAHGILQARILEWVAMPSSRGLFRTQGSNPGLPPCRWILYHLSHQESPTQLLERINDSLWYTDQGGKSIEFDKATVPVCAIYFLGGCV